MRKKTVSSVSPVGIVTVLLMILLILTTGCLTNPVTGRPGPSWQVPLRIPLIAAEITVTDLLDQVDFEAEPGEDGGFQAQFSMEKAFDLEGVEVSFDPTIITVDAVEIPLGVITSFSFATKLDLTELWSDGVLEEIAFSGGSLTIDLNADANAAITAIAVGDHRQDGNSLNLKGVKIVDKAELKVEGTLSDKDAHNIKNITVTLNAGSDQISSLTGRSLQFEIPTQSIDVDFEIPEDLKDVKFSNTGMNLAIKYDSAAGKSPTIDLSGLSMTGLTMPKTIFEGETLVIFDSKEATELLNSLPDAITVGGQIQTGDASSTVSFADTLQLEFTVVVPFEFELKSDIIFESGVTEVDASQASLEGLEDLTSSFYGEFDLEYRMPLGAKVELFLSNNDQPMQDQDAIRVEVLIDAAKKDAAGRTTDANREIIPVELPEATRDMLQEKAYAQVKITISADEHDLIAFTEQDYATVKAWVELLINVNK